MEGEGNFVGTNLCKIVHLCTYEPTAGLRWHNPKLENLYDRHLPSKLQQLWFCSGCGEKEWRDVPDQIKAKEIYGEVN